MSFENIALAVLGIAAVAFTYEWGYRNGRYNAEKAVKPNADPYFPTVQQCIDTIALFRNGDLGLSDNERKLRKIAIQTLSEAMISHVSIYSNEEKE